MPADTIRIRPAHERDLPELAELIRDHARYERAGEVRPDLMTALIPLLFAQHPRMYVLVAARNDGLIGYASWGLEVSTWQAGEYAHLDCLYLREVDRGHGLGRELMDAVEADARAAGATQLQWQTPTWNDSAIRFYRRSGAREAAKMRYTLPLTGHCVDTARHPST